MLTAGIVLYNPDIERLSENLNSIWQQVDKIILVDNGSNNITEIETLLKGYSNVTLEKNLENLGVAKALNQITKKADELGAEWVLTLDQDSVCLPDLVSEYEKNKNDEKIASMTCRITDRSFAYLENENTKDTYVKTCITSGNYIRISCWKKIRYFDEALFIDKVDTDFCYRIIQAGYRILQISYNGIIHEVGNKTRCVSFFGKKITVFNHSPFRVYYLIRNQIYFARKHKESLGKKGYYRYTRTAWTRIFVYLLWESEKYSKLCMWIKGILDGYRMEICKDGESAD